MENLHMFDYTFLQDKPPQGVALLLEEIKRSQERLRDYRRAYPGIYSVSLHDALPISAFTVR